MLEEFFIAVQLTALVKHKLNVFAKFINFEMPHSSQANRI